MHPKISPQSKSAFTLLELLLTLSLILLISSSMIFNFSSLSNNKNIINQNKIDNYQSLARYTQAYAELSGKKTKISLTPSHSISSLIESTSTYPYEYIPIPELQSQLEILNQNAAFSILSIDDPSPQNDPIDPGNQNNNNETNVVTFSPDGSIDQSSPLSILPNNNNDNPNDNTNNSNSPIISIDPYNHFHILP